MSTKKSLLLIVILLVIQAVVFSSAQAQTPGRQASKVIASPNGQRLYYVWEEQVTTTDWDIWFAYSTDQGNTWQGHKQINLPNARKQYQPKVAVDGAGTIYLIWLDNSTMVTSEVWNIYFSRSMDEGITWSTPTRINDVADKVDPDRTRYRTGIDLATYKNGTVYVVWADNRDGRKMYVYTRYSTDSGNTWLTPKNIRTSGATDYVEDPTIAIDDNGTVYAVWSDERTDNKVFLYMASSTVGSSTWSANKPIYDKTTTSKVGQSDIVAWGTGALCLAWHDEDDDKVRSVYSTNKGITWSTTKIINTASVRQGAFELAHRAGTNEVFAVWNEDLEVVDATSSNPNQVLAARSIDGCKNWQSIGQVNSNKDSDTDFPGVAYGSAGEVYVSWINDHAAGTSEDRAYVARSNNNGTSWSHYDVLGTPAPTSTPTNTPIPTATNTPQPTPVMQNHGDLKYSTMLGGNAFDNISKVVVVGGYVYVTGMTESWSIDFLNGMKTYGSCIDQANIFVAKFKLDGNGLNDLIYATVLCGNGYSYPESMAVDSAGNAYIMGDSQGTSFYGLTKKGTFIAKINADGTTSTNNIKYIGDASGRAITVDKAGNLYAALEVGSAILTATSGAYDTSFNGGSDILILKLSASNLATSYVTYLGGENSDDVHAIALDSKNNLYLTGNTQSLNFPYKGTFGKTFNGGTNDAFIVKLNLGVSGTNALQYAGYLGGSAYDIGYNLALDMNDNVYVAGWTESANFPTQNAFDTSTDGSSDNFIVKIGSNGAIAYATLFGGSKNEGYPHIAVDSTGNLYLFTDSASTDMPTTTNAIKTTLSGSSDAFVAKVDPTGTQILYGSYFGGTNNEYAWGIALDGTSPIIVGQTTSIDFPTSVGAYDVTFQTGNDDAFIVKLGAPNGTVNVPATPTPLPVVNLAAPVLNQISNASGQGNYSVIFNQVQNATSYQLQEDDNDQFTSPILREPFTVLNAVDMSWKASNLPVGSYYYRARACNSSGCGPWSTYPRSTQVCTLPGDANVTPLPSNSVFYYGGQNYPVVKWDKAANATDGYEVILYTNDYNNPEITKRIYTPDPPAAGLTIEDALADGFWIARVRGINQCGAKGSLSNLMTFRYFGTPPETPTLHVDEVYDPQNFIIDWTDVGYNVIYELRLGQANTGKVELVYRGPKTSFTVPNKGTGVFNMSLIACYSDPADASKSLLCSEPAYKTGVVVLGKPSLAIQGDKVIVTLVPGAETQTLWVYQNGTLLEKVDASVLNYYPVSKTPSKYNFQVQSCKGYICTSSDVKEVIVPGGPLSNQPLEGVWISQTQAGTADEYFKVIENQMVKFTVVIQNLGTATWKRDPGYGQVFLSTSKSPGQVSAPSQFGFDDCFNGPNGTFGNPGPNCGLSYFSYFGQGGWLDKFYAATINSSQVVQGDMAVFETGFQIRDRADLGKFIEGFTLAFNQGTAENPQWVTIPHTANSYNGAKGKDGSVYVWVGFDIQGDTTPTPTPTSMAPSMKWVDQSGFNNDKAYIIDVPLDTEKNLSVVFENTSDVPLLAKDVVLAMYKPLNPPNNMCAFSKDHPKVYAYADFDSWDLVNGFVVTLNHDVAPDEQGVFNFTLEANHSEYPERVNDVPCDVHFVVMYKDGSQWKPMPNHVNPDDRGYATAWWTIKDDPNIPCSDSHDYEEVCVAQSLVTSLFGYEAYHSYIIIRVPNRDEYANVPGADTSQFKKRGNAWETTISAFPVTGTDSKPGPMNWGKLTKGQGGNDIDASDTHAKSITLPIIESKPEYRDRPFIPTMKDLIIRLFRATELYWNDLHYDPLGYTCNSYVHGILRMAGIGGSYQEEIEKYGGKGLYTPGWEMEVFSSDLYKERLCWGTFNPGNIQETINGVGYTKANLFNAVHIWQREGSDQGPPVSTISGYSGDEKNFLVRMFNAGSAYWCNIGSSRVTFNVYKDVNAFPKSAPPSVLANYESTGTSFFRRDNTSWVDQFAAATAREGIIAPGEEGTYNIKLYFRPALPLLPVNDYVGLYREDFTLAIGSPGGLWIQNTYNGRGKVKKSGDPCVVVSETNSCVANTWVQLNYQNVTYHGSAQISSNGGTFQLSPAASLTTDSNTFNNTINLKYTQLFKPTTLVRERPITETVIPSTGTLKDINFFYDLTATYLDGTPAQPLKPYTITLIYTPTNGVNEASLALYYHDGTQWVKEASSRVDTVAHTVTATPNHFSLWAILADTTPPSLTIINRITDPNQWPTLTFRISDTFTATIAANKAITLTTLAAGSYRIGITSYPDQYWGLINVSCVDQKRMVSNIDHDNLKADITIWEGQNLVCTFLSEWAGYTKPKTFIWYLPFIVKQR